MDGVWSEVSGLLAPCLKIDGCSTPETLLSWLREGVYQLWVEGEFKAAATTTIDVYPAKKVCTVVHLGGKGMVKWLHEGMEAIEEFARGEKCDLIRINGRREWSRVLPGFRQTAIVSERVL